MSVFDNLNDQVINALRDGKIAIMRTDTIYGIVARADNEAAVEQVYNLKGRTPSKPPIILIGRVEDMFSTPSEAERAFMAELWPGKNSLIVADAHAPRWITRGGGTVAYRLPDDENLQALLVKTGPLIAPSANPEGMEPAMDIDEAQSYFGDRISYYIDSGRVTDNTPSRLFRLTEAGLERLR